MANGKNVRTTMMPLHYILEEGEGRGRGENRERGYGGEDKESNIPQKTWN